jgi:hypothetical protein
MHIPVATAGFEEDYQGYLKTYDTYRTAYEKYVTTRNQYLTYDTLNAKNDALTAVKDMLIKRDEVLLSYISLLKVTDYDKTYTSLVDDESTFLFSHKEQIPAVGTLEDAVTKSGEVEKRHLPFQVTSKKITASVLYNKIIAARDGYLSLESEATTLIHNLKLQNKDVSTLERWLLEAKNKQLQADQKLSLASTQISGLDSGSLENLNAEYAKIQFTLFEANQYIKEALRFMTELTESLKYGQF